MRGAYMRGRYDTLSSDIGRIDPICPLCAEATIIGVGYALLCPYAHLIPCLDMA